MREFDHFEKDVIRKLKECKENGRTINFLNLLANFLNGRGVEIKRSTKEGWIYFNVKKFAYYDASINAWIPKGNLSTEVASATELVIKLIFLLDYLESKGLVFLYDFSHADNDLESFPEIQAGPSPIRLSITEKKVVELLIAFFHKEIVISQSIISLVNNKFLTKREIQHLETIAYANRSLITGERSITMANRATVVSVVLGIISVLLSLYSINQAQGQLESPMEPKQTRDHTKTEDDKKINVISIKPGSGN
jgi:hypothetical protein